MMGVTVTVGLMVLLFKPKWLDDIQPQNPANRFAGDPVYPPSRLTAKVVASDRWSAAHGTIVPRDEQLAHQAKVEGARRARKEARAREVAGRADRMDAKAERRAAKDARRIMMARRQQIIAAFTAEEM